LNDKKLFGLRILLAAGSPSQGFSGTLRILNPLELEKINVIG